MQRGHKLWHVALKGRDKVTVTCQICSGDLWHRPQIFTLTHHLMGHHLFAWCFATMKGEDDGGSTEVAESRLKNSSTLTWPPLLTASSKHKLYVFGHIFFNQNHSSCRTVYRLIIHSEMVCDHVSSSELSQHYQQLRMATCCWCSTSEGRLPWSWQESL